MSLKAVLFDMDGVIVDTEPLHRKAYYQMFDFYNIQVSQELFSSFTGRTTQSTCEELASTFNLPSVEELIEKKRLFFEELFYSDSDFDLLPGVKNLIENYHNNGLTMVLASSASRKTIDMVFEKFNLNPFFVGKISGADLQASKPHPEIFQLAAKIANQPIENCMVIEDSTNGIIASHKAGIFCVAYKSFHTHNQDYSLANLIISEYSEIETDKISKHF